MRKRKPAPMWVHPDFKKEIKRNAVDNDLSILDYTESLARKKRSRNHESLFEW